MSRILFPAVALFFALLAFPSRAQTTLILGGDSTFCGYDSLLYFAELDTTLFTLDSAANSAAILNNIDDMYSDALPVGFPFVFYGDTFTACLLSTNGYITFDLTDMNGYSPWAINTPIPSAATPLNAIFGPWHDTYPGAWGAPFPGEVSYKTFGAAPNRYTVFNFCLVPMFSCTDSSYSGQIVMFEGTNVIETHIARKPICEGWNDGQAIHGLHNADGTLAHVVPGRNAGTQWSAVNDGFRFTPNGPDDYIIDPIPYSPVAVSNNATVFWYLDGNLVNTGNSVQTNLGLGSHQLVAQVVGCFGTVMSDTVNLDLLAGLGINPSFAFQPFQCPGGGNAFAAVELDLPAYLNITWSDTSGNVIQSISGEVSGDTITSLVPGSYVLSVADTGGCVYHVQPFTILSDTFTAGFTTVPPFPCVGDSVTFYNTTLGIATDFSWSFGDGGTSSEVHPAHAYAAPGVYDVTLASSSVVDGCMDSVSQMITVNAAAPPVTIDGPVTAVQFITYQYSVSVPAGTAVQWEAIGGTVVSGLNDDTVSVQWTDGVSGGWLSVVAGNGMCIETAALLVGVLTGIDEPGSTGAVIVYPSPVVDRLNVESQKPVTALRVVALDGRLVDIPGTHGGESLAVDVAALPAAHYILELDFSDGERKRFLVQKSR